MVDQPGLDIPLPETVRRSTHRQCHAFPIALKCVKGGFALVGQLALADATAQDKMRAQPDTDGNKHAEKQDDDRSGAELLCIERCGRPDLHSPDRARQLHRPDGAEAFTDRYSGLVDEASPLCHVNGDKVSRLRGKAAADHAGDVENTDNQAVETLIHEKRKITKETGSALHEIDGNAVIGLAGIDRAHDGAGSVFLE